MTVLTTTSRRSPYAGRTLPIARPAGLFLYAGAGDGQRFADLFNRVLFQRLPRSAANELLRYWEEQGPPEQVTKPTPMPPGGHRGCTAGRSRPRVMRALEGGDFDRAAFYAEDDVPSSDPRGPAPRPQGAPTRVRSKQQAL
jgi:hypothetical protein